MRTNYASGKGAGAGKGGQFSMVAEQVKHACSELVNARTHLPAQDCASVLSHTSHSQPLEAF